MQINPMRLGLIIGIFLAAIHITWAAMVAIGWAQPLMNFVFWVHFITPPYQIEPFEVGRATLLAGFTFAVGLVLGSVGAVLWNRLAKID